MLNVSYFRNIVEIIIYVLSLLDGKYFGRRKIMWNFVVVKMFVEKVIECVEHLWLISRPLCDNLRSQYLIVVKVHVNVTDIMKICNNPHAWKQGVYLLYGLCVRKQLIDVN